MTAAYTRSYEFASGVLNAVFDRPILLFIPAIFALLMMITGAVMRERERQRKVKLKAEAEARRREALERFNAERKAEREAERAAIEAEKQRQREERAAARAAKAAAKAAMPKRPRGRPPKAKPVPPDNAPPAPQDIPQPEPPAPPPKPQHPPDVEPPFHWPPKGNDAFRGQRMVITGTLSMGQAEAWAAIWKNGGIAQSDIQASTTTLVTGQGADERKVQWARENNVRIIPEFEFSIMCSQPVDLTPEQFVEVSAML